MTAIIASHMASVSRNLVAVHAGAATGIPMPSIAMPSIAGIGRSMPAMR